MPKIQFSNTKPKSYTSARKWSISLWGHAGLQLYLVPATYPPDKDVTFNVKGELAMGLLAPWCPLPDGSGAMVPQEVIGAPPGRA